MSFSSEELSRYQRHLSLRGFGTEAQAKLKAGSVLVIGAGGLGCPALLYLAAAGVGRIVLIDADRVEISNLQRQVLYTSNDAGELKVIAAARRVRELNPLIAIEPHAERFTRANALAFVRSCDVVIDGSDNFATRYLVNDACILANRPLVYGAIHGFEGQASVFNWQGGPTYRCLFPEPPEPGSVPNCADAGVLGVLPGLIGTVQATEAIKLLTGIGEPLSGKLFLWNALTMATRTVKFSSDPRSRSLSELPPEGYGKSCAARSINSSEIEISELKIALASGRTPQLIDVRESWERALGSIEPSAHIPFATLELEGAPGINPITPTVVYCAAGARSLRAALSLRERYGFKNVSSLRGGYQAWSTSR